MVSIVRVLLIGALVAIPTAWVVSTMGIGIVGSLSGAVGASLPIVMIYAVLTMGGSAGSTGS
ncbi:MAG: hypothetical protein ACOC8O_00730 [Natronomonas sp.]